ncbi:TIGR03564 family F420-dependent LLM class oxidoreductase [Streptomyces sp. NBS 14/10]|uniref:TIGR03564 family F420-dependent LLM class oxidoreductase n=1 Tax=Streptomyces sp. NBS 14/10 TaxID=1945643 RepID=UPI0015C60C97|nr:TIGR03564 family F420-dependent LLM class oxidoreductase [Streptomyces sp. NBS 14/10]KAK1184798.1 TIGR03564 family F420-dependent LLM class oxidoreductase [Streptomyces sp. NBS 14/10]NUP36131.1 TIGR03564 family F420-dependent LLM class oxidoreductase [Streptomyces sp.]NUS90725.1 TIGR03564 family F420-dependent LLM class oxidoreductase [Streptomyces sp.]
MRIGVALPTDFTRLSQEANSVDTLIGQVKELADAGLSAAWFTQRFDHDAITVAALAAREVPGIDIGTAVVPIYPRHPIALSMQAQTAQAASHGRFTLGVGLSTKSFVEQTYGLAPHPRVRHLREHLEALRSLLETGSVDFSGETLVAKTSLSTTVPGARPRVPVLVAVAGEQTLRAAGELADGALPIMSGPRTLAEYTVPTLTRHAEAAGRPAPRVAVIVSGVVTADVAGARARAEQNMAPYKNLPAYRAALDREGIDNPVDLVAIGDEELLAAQVAAYFEAGATELIYTQTAIGSPEDERRTWKLLGELAARG